MNDEQLPLVTLQSVRGGRKLDWLGFGERKPETIDFSKDETGKPLVLQDFLTYVLGYAARDLKAGERMYMKITDCKKLFELLRREFR